MSPGVTAGFAGTVAVLVLALLPAVSTAAEPGAAGPPRVPAIPDRFPTVDLTTKAPDADFAKLAPAKGESVRVIVGLQTEFTPEARSTTSA